MSGVEEKNISDKIMIVKLMVHDWHVFSALKEYSYFNTTPGRLEKENCNY